MNERSSLPHILIIDDLFGRTHSDRRNEERANLCGQYLIEDVTGDEIGKGAPQKIKNPIAQAVFYRGLKPICSAVGDTVEHDLEGTLRVIRDGWSVWRPHKPRWAMVLLDLCFYTGRVTEASNRKTLGMPEGHDGDDDPRRYFGLRILQAVYDAFPDLPVVILSSKPREEVSREFSYRGALGFLPREAERSPELLWEYIWRHGLVSDDNGEIVGHSIALLLALRTARRAASRRQNILIRGEWGTGKELVARYIHRQGKNLETTPFVVVNSSVLTPKLFASELLGIEERVATGVARRVGKIREADGGDLFLDEIKDMLPQVQAGILRVIEERSVTAVGATKPQPVDVRFLSATNIEIEVLAAPGRFRSEFLDRLREGGTVLLPPLRERMEDIPLLMEKFVRDAEHANPGALRRQIDPEVLDRIRSYDWPGNIRELRQCIFNAVNDHPDVEYLVPVHIQLPTVRILPEKPVAVAQATVSRTSAETRSVREGLIAIMFTDMEGFSAMTQRLGDRKGLQTLQAHNRILREQLHLHEGHEEDSAGDGFMLVFQSCRRAVACAVSLQRALAEYNAAHPEEPIRVRCGLSVGEPLKKDEHGGYYGRSVIEGARISAKANGGQVFVSELVYTMLQPSGDFEFQEAGVFELEGLAGIHKVYEVVW